MSPFCLIGRSGEISNQREAEPYDFSLPRRDTRRWRGPNSVRPRENVIEPEWPHRVTDDLRRGEKIRRGLCADSYPPRIALAARALPDLWVFREQGAAPVDQHTGEPKSDRLRIVSNRSIRPRDVLLGTACAAVCRV
jgi:hypothetical protein